MGEKKQREAWIRSRDPEEVREAFKTQMRHLDRSAQAFDEGDVSEAQRIAAIIFMLCHDRGQSVSLLTQLGVKHEMAFYDSARPRPADPNLFLGQPPLIAFQLVGGAKIYGAPGVHAHTPRIGFKQWWETIVYNNLDGGRLSRADLVRNLRDQDGGGHFDPMPTNEAYHRFAKHGDYVTEGATRNRFIMLDLPPGLHLHSMRQIAHEVTASVAVLGY